MRSRTIELSVGFFVLAGFLGLLFLAVEVSGVKTASSDEGYIVRATFDDVAGLRVRGKVSMAGVTIGRVTDISVDMEWGSAIVDMEIFGQPGGLTTDTAAKILTEGILGARYVSLMPGSDEEKLSSGDEITDTQGALVLENLIGEFVTNLGES
jgi:phospholipid/cholesterol/gamma-HCH transport system substrate-binding protein